ncbi:hypothetical protein FB45DRAFT_1055395 [Roridomyces roridus]|uniref:Uncharacterized protein n=1 Tax=Roridomyces roridus TaxID=1738132 RepID=A0AAD7FRX6_9AGAR|nr:hypothetical protein FB45DRAFT_1055395 [Roridomyces roridus]
MQHSRTLIRRPQRLVTMTLRRFIRSEATDDDAVQAVAEFQSNLQSITAESFLRTVNSISASNLRMQRWLRRENMDLNEQLRVASGGIYSAVLTYTNLTEDLRSRLETSSENLHIRSAIEIITATLTERSKALNLPNHEMSGTGRVQPILNALGAGAYDDHKINFVDAETAVIEALSPNGGVTHRDVRQVLGRLWVELSMHHRSGVSEVLTLNEGELMLPETISAMAVVLFARRLYFSDFDAEYRDSTGRVRGTVSRIRLYDSLI